MFRRRERGAISHAITFLDDMAVHIPTLDVWNQFVWSPSAAAPRAVMQVEQYGYRHRNAVDLGTVMLVMELRVTDKEGAYLCMVRALIYEGSVLAYNPTRNKMEWVPTCGVTNDLSWAEERMAITMANFVPHGPQEADHIEELRTCHLLAWTDSSSEEEEGKQMQEEGDEPEEDEGEEVEGWGNQTLKRCPVMRHAGRAKPNHDDNRENGHP